MNRIVLVIALSVLLPMSVMAQPDAKQTNTDLNLPDGFMEVHKNFAGSNLENSISPDK